MRVFLSVMMLVAVAACSPAKEEAPPPAPVAEKPSEALIAGIRIDAPRAVSRIESPVDVSGLVEPGWFLEGTFDVAVVDAEGLALGRSPAKPTAEIVGEAPVAFATTVTFKQPAEDKPGMVVFTEENSDPNDEARQLRLPVTLAAKSAK